MPANATSYIGKKFTIADPQALVRRSDDLDEFVRDNAGKAVTIADGAAITIDDVRVRAEGNDETSLFVHALAANGSALGWTSAGNVKGKLIGETLRLLKPPANPSQTGPFAAWKKGVFLGQINLVEIVGTGGEVKRVAESTVDSFLAMANAALAAGRIVTINSGFRSFGEQEALFRKFQRNGSPLTARAGRSNHQNGIAFDLSVKPGPGNPNYEWLTRNATKFGFLRTVASETWHWEFKPDRAAIARAAGRFFEFP